MTSQEGKGTLDLRELKRQTENHKGIITRTMNAQEPFKDLSLDELDPKEVINIEKAAEDAVQNYEEIQGLIEEFAEDSRYAGEDLSDIGQSHINKALLKDARAIAKAHQLWLKTEDLLNRAKCLEKAFSLIADSILQGTVIDRLRKRMDRPREVYLRALKNFLSFGTVEHDKAGLATVASDHLKSLHTLERYGDGCMGQILIELKMSNKFRPEWAIHHGKPEVIPHVSHLIQFVEARQSILEATIAKNAASSAQPTKSAKPHHTPGPNRGSVMQARTFPSTCPACNEDHAIYSCSQFRSWDVERRKT